MERELKPNLLILLMWKCTNQTLPRDGDLCNVISLQHVGQHQGAFTDCGKNHQCFSFSR